MIDGLKPYPNGLRAVPNEPWLGSVPVHWSVVRLKTVVENVADQTADVEKSERYIGLEHIESWTGRVRTARASAVSGQVKRFQSGDVLFGKLRPYLAKVVRPAFDGVCTGELLVLRPSSPDAHGPYMEHLLRSAGFIHLVNSTTFGARMPRAEWAVVGTIGIPLPPPAEQAGIVRFLGAVDRKVNRFIRAKRRLIEVLTEQKQAIITHAVTKGLNPHAPLKPSGIDWLGDVPEHWEVRKLRFLVDTLGGMTPSKADQSFWNGDVPWVSPKDMKSVEIAGSIDHITQSALSQTNITLIPSPAVLIVVRGMILARTFPVGITTLPVTINQDMKALRPRNSSVGVNALYLRHLLSGLGDVVKMLIEESGHGTRVLRTDLWRNLPLPVPPRSEQEAICDYVADQTSVFDQAAGQARREIDLIREYRTRLVADVVTGKVDVRAAAASIPDEPSPPAGEEFATAEDDGPVGADEADGDDPAEHTPEEVEA